MINAFAHPDDLSETLDCGVPVLLDDPQTITPYPKCALFCANQRTSFKESGHSATITNCRHGVSNGGALIPESGSRFWKRNTAEAEELAHISDQWFIYNAELDLKDGTNVKTEAATQNFRDGNGEIALATDKATDESGCPFSGRSDIFFHNDMISHFAFKVNRGAYNVKKGCAFRCQLPQTVPCAQL